MGTEQFLMESISNPEKMREFAIRLASESCEPLKLTVSRFSRIPEGYLNWMPFWSDSPMNTVQDDMAINFSPEMYADIFLPALKLIASAVVFTFTLTSLGITPDTFAATGVPAPEVSSLTRSVFGRFQGIC